jgi:hypothetical protein
MRSRTTEVAFPPVATSALLLAAAMVLACGSGEWVAFESPEGGFRVEFPVKPTHTTSADGQEHRYTAQYGLADGLLRASYELDFDTTTTIESRIAAIESAPAVTRFTGPVTVTVGGHPGLEASYEMEEGGTSFAMRHRIFHVGTTSYQLQAVIEEGQSAEPDVERFFASFALLPK